MTDSRRVFVLVLDSLGVGALPDADQFGDAGAHTLDHIVQAAGGLDVPRLAAYGLGNVPGVSGVAPAADPLGAYGRMAERSAGKDTSTGHWEMMGCPLEEAFPVFPEGFSEELLSDWAARCDLPGWLCNAPASGTEVLARLGEEHVRTGKPIVYTSADSVFQVAAHESHFGLDRLYECCLAARELTEPLGLGRVIARPFVGEPGSYARTYNRKDYSLAPPRETSLDRLKAAGVPVVGIGKIRDIFAGRGISRDIHTEGNLDGMEQTIETARLLHHGFVFVNLVDFDMLFGHRRDPVGYRRALEQFDDRLATLEAELRQDDVLILTADHGNDPTKPEHTDHTREYVPLLVTGAGIRSGVELGTRTSFADVGATVEELFGLAPKGAGTSFLGAIERAEAGA